MRNNNKTIGPGQSIIDSKECQKAYFAYRDLMKQLYPEKTISVNDFIAGWNAAKNDNNAKL